MKLLHIDCAYGLGGDMFLALLANMGLDLEPLERMFVEQGLIRSLGVDPVKRNAVMGGQLRIEHEPGQPLRTLGLVRQAMDGLDISAGVRQRADQAFTRLAEAEAEVHGIDMDRVHFHEVGAVDTLVDIVGAFWGLEQLGVSRVTSSHLPWFTGTVLCEHGELPLPAPATAKLLQGKPVYSTEHDTELITPTGAVLLDQLVDEYQHGPQGKLQSSGLAYGQRETGGGLRGYLLDPSGEAPDTGRSIEWIWVLESNIDHLSGEDLGHAIKVLMKAGAVDALYTPGVMKKNRPGGALQAMCRDDALEAVETAFFRNTLTKGIRRSRMQRVVLERSPAELETPLGSIKGKRFSLDGEEYVFEEYEGLKELARETGRTVAELRAMLRLGDKKSRGKG